MLLTSNQSTKVQYYVRLASGQDIGPYSTFEQAQLSAATMPVTEGSPTIYTLAAGGQQVLFG